MRNNKVAFESSTICVKKICTKIGSLNGSIFGNDHKIPRIDKNNCTKIVCNLKNNKTKVLLPQA